MKIIPPKGWLAIVVIFGVLGIVLVRQIRGTEVQTETDEVRIEAIAQTSVSSPTATFNGTPVNFAIFILPGTATPTLIPTATPIVPVFRDGNYTVGVAEMQIRETVTCGATVFSNQDNSLLVTNLSGMSFSMTVAQHGTLDTNQDGWIAIDNAGNFGIGHDAGGWHTDWMAGCH